MNDVFGKLAADLAKMGAPVLGGLIGTAVGGPAGAAIGGLAGKAIEAVAETLGADPTPEAIGAAIQNDPSAAAKITAVEARAPDMAREWEEETKRLAEVAVTQRLELASESAFIRNARPFSIWAIGGATVGFAVVFVATAIGAIIAYWQTRDIASFKAFELVVNSAPGFMLALTPAGAVAGVAAWGRTKEKLNGVAGVSPLDIIRAGANVAVAATKRGR